MRETVPLSERFWRAVDMSGPCWLWTGAKHPDGYGEVRYGRSRSPRRVFAHRYAYNVLVGPVPDGLELDHLCRVRACVNPDHLEPVTHAENMRRSRSDSCKNGHPFDDANTYVLVTRRGHEKRGCRACTAAAQRRYQARRRAAA